MLRRKVLDEDECHSGICGKMLKESCKCFQPSGGSANTDNGKESPGEGKMLIDPPSEGTGLMLQRLNIGRAP